MVDCYKKYVVRCSELMRILKLRGRESCPDGSATHMAKLPPRLSGGSGDGCPIVVIGIGEACHVED
jgi:hypothetical protein